MLRRSRRKPSFLAGEKYNLANDHHGFCILAFIVRARKRFAHIRNSMRGNDRFQKVCIIKMTATIETLTRIDDLRDRVLLLGGKTEEAVRRSIRSLTSRDSELAKSVCDADRLIDQMELEIDQLCVEILAEKRLAEHDLRMVVSVAKITPILERIADHAASIAEAAIALNNEPEIDNYFDFSQMAVIASGMLREALDAFTAENSEASRRIIARDAELDSRYARVFDDLLLRMVKRPDVSGGAARLLFVAKHLERIGDYVKDICELNVYLTEAVFIKHSQPA
jgi:phosphate transport system protein